MRRNLRGYPEAVVPAGHVCHLRDPAAAPWAGLLPFVLDALDGGGACLCVVGARTRGWLMGELEARGREPDSAMADGRLAVWEDRERLWSGRSPVSSLVSRLRRRSTAARGSGGAVLRVAVDATWLLGEAAPGLVGAYERAMSVLVAEGLLVAACAHEVGTGGAVLEEVLRAHPFVQRGAAMCPNPFFDPAGAEERGGVDRLRWKLDRLAAQLDATVAADRAAGAGAAVLAAVPAPVFLTDAEGRLLDANPAGRAIWSELVGPGAAGASSSPVPIAEGRREVEVETAAGDRRVLLSQVAPLRGSAAGESVAVHLDVTELKRMESALLDSRERYRRIFDANPHPLWVYDLESLRFLAVNRAAIEKYGYSREEFLAMTIADIRPAEDLPRLREHLAGPDVGQGFAGTWTHRLRDGRRIRVEIISYELSFGGRRAELVLAHDVTARVAAEEALADREAAYRTLVENSPDLIVRFDRGLRHVYVSPVVERMTGKPPAFFLGRTHRELRVPPELAELWDEALRGVFSSGETREIRFARRGADGSTHHFEARLFAELGAAGEVATVLAFTRDVTAVVRSAEALRRSEERYRLVGRATNDVIWDWDFAWDRLDWSEALDTVFGYPLHEVEPVFDWWVERVHPDDRERAVSSIHAVLDGPGEAWSAEYRFRRSDDTYATVFDRGYVLRDATGRAVRMIGSIMDLTERLQAEAALRESEEHRRFAMEAAGVGTWEWEPATGRVRWSEQIHRLHGLEPAEFASSYEDWSRLLHPDDLPRVEAAIAGAIQADNPYQVEFRTVWPDGTLHWIAVRGQTLRTRGGGVRLIGIAMDVTDRRLAEAERSEILRREQELRHAAETASRAKSEFLSVVSHELRTPLATASAFADVLESESAGTLGEPQRVAVQRIQASVWHLNDLVGEILDYTRLERGQLSIVSEPVDVAALVQEVARQMEPLAAAKGLPLRLEVSPEPMVVPSDPVRVKQILLNLVSNAIKFTQAGHVLLRLARRPGEVAVEVADTGIGIAPEDVARVFDPFWQVESPLTRRHEGTGLGLAISRALAELLGARLELRSTPGQGSRFTLLMPQPVVRLDANQAAAGGA
jgi:PAS domain S-box-containing protein